MRKEFPGYYSLREEEFAEVWDSGLIVLDSSALLSLFRYSVPTSTQVLAALRAKADQLWIPRQVGIEFHRNRDGVIRAQHEAIDKIERSADEANSRTVSAIREYKRHPSLPTDDLLRVLQKNKRRLRKAIRAARRRHDELVETTGANDTTFAAISDLYEGKIGAAWGEDALATLYKEGAERFDRKVPPGYEDKRTKQEPDMYGDLVIWRQILEHAKSQDMSVLFVTDDLKEDWWWIVEGKRRGARPELVAEFAAHVGKHVAFVSPDRFLEIARKKGVEIATESLEEVEEVTAGRNRIDAHVVPDATSKSWELIRAETSGESPKFADYEKAFASLSRIPSGVSVAEWLAADARRAGATEPSRLATYMLSSSPGSIARESARLAELHRPDADDHGRQTFIDYLAEQERNQRLRRKLSGPDAETDEAAADVPSDGESDK